MSDHELRKVLEDVMDDIRTGRVDVRPHRFRLGRWLGPPLVAVAMGMAGCDHQNVGNTSDAASDGSSPDAVTQVDGGTDDSAVAQDAEVDALVDADVDALVDAEVDAIVVPPYAAPPIHDFDLTARAPA